jgi:hypothetical protein
MQDSRGKKEVKKTGVKLLKRMNKIKFSPLIPLKELEKKTEIFFKSSLIYYSTYSENLKQEYA